MPQEIIEAFTLSDTRLIGVIAQLNRRPLALLVDTGSSHIALLPEVIADLGLRKLNTSPLLATSSSGEERTELGTVV